MSEISDSGDFNFSDTGEDVFAPSGGSEWNASGGNELAGSGGLETGSPGGTEIGAEIFSGDGAPFEVSSEKEGREISAQEMVEGFHSQSVAQILEENGKYMSIEDSNRAAAGVNEIRAVEYNPDHDYIGVYTFLNGRSTIEIASIDPGQMERTTIHETNHFMSHHREVFVPQPDRNGYTVYSTVGVRETSFFLPHETSIPVEFTSKGEGLNEGLTTMFTNQQLMEISEEKGLEAERQNIYSHATEICKQLEGIIGTDTLKEAYYGGDLGKLEQKVDALAGERGYETLRDCLDRTLEKDWAERVVAMKEAQSILSEMYKNGGIES
ncbi:MAG: hypothetical protein J5750_07295 [Clostridiales bacterium]|nr:hypothetical protein [Clostridiales bacterium]